MSTRETSIAGLKDDLRWAVADLQRRKLVWDKPSPLIELIPRYLEEAPVGAPEIIEQISADDDFASLAVDAFRLAYLLDPAYTAVDCHWMFTDQWQLMLSGPTWGAEWHARFLRDVQAQHYPKTQEVHIRFLRDVFDNTNDSYLRSRAAFFLVHEYGDESADVQKAYADAGYNYVLEYVDDPEPFHDSRESVPSSMMYAKNWSDSFDDFEPSDWEQFMGGGDDDRDGDN